MVAHLVRLKLTLLRNIFRRSRAPAGRLPSRHHLRARASSAAASPAWSPCAFARRRAGPRAVVVARRRRPSCWLRRAGAVRSASTRPSTRVASPRSPCPDRELRGGLVAAALVGLPGVATVCRSRRPRRHLVALAAMAVVVALGAAVVGVLTCVTLSRVATSGVSAVGQTPARRELASAAGGLLLVVSGLVSARVGAQVGRAGPACAPPAGAARLDAVRAGPGRRPATSRPAHLGTGLLRLLLAVAGARAAAGPVGRGCCAGPWRTRALGQRRDERRSAPRPRMVRPAARHADRAPSPHARSPTGAATPATWSPWA